MGQIVAGVVVFQDITERKRMERLREDDVRIVSHDPRTPLTIILGQADLLRRSLATADQDSPQRRGAEAIATAARRMSVMIRDLVDSARLESGQLHWYIACRSAFVFLGSRWYNQVSTPKR